MLRFLGIGLPRTGTRSLAKALEILGFRSIHFHLDRYDLGAVWPWDFHRYDDVEAACDLPGAFFYREVLLAYPEARDILTVRDLTSWWRSIHAWSQHLYQAGPGSRRQARRLHAMALGAPDPEEALWKYRYQQWVAAVLHDPLLHPGRLLVLDVVGGEGWAQLCPFVDREIPDQPFPYLNQQPMAGATP